MISLYDKAWPLLLVEFSGLNSDQEFVDYLKRMTEFASRRAAWLPVLDASKASPLPSQQRHMQLGWLGAHGRRLQAHALGSSFVITTPAVKATFNIILMLRPLTCPFLVTESMGGALRWAAGRFEESGMAAEARRVRAHFGVLTSEKPSVRPQDSLPQRGAGPGERMNPSEPLQGVGAGATTRADLTASRYREKGTERTEASESGTWSTVERA